MTIKWVRRWFSESRLDRRIRELINGSGNRRNAGIQTCESWAPKGSSPTSASTARSSGPVARALVMQLLDREFLQKPTQPLNHLD
jgi:hypothetical protein